MCHPWLAKCIWQFGFFLTSKEPAYEDEIWKLLTHRHSCKEALGIIDGILYKYRINHRWEMRKVWVLLKGALRVIKTVCRILSVLYLSQNTQCLELQREWSESIVEKHGYVTSKVHRDTIDKTILNKRLLMLVKLFMCRSLWDWRLVLITAVRW